MIKLQEKASQNYCGRGKPLLQFSDRGATAKKPKCASMRISESKPGLTTQKPPAKRREAAVAFVGFETQLTGI